MVARAIHYGSRAKGPFVEINCAAIPSSLLEAELFGYEKGAYTDARTAKPGLFEAADGGTLFLDEIGHMEVGLQVKLLKAIEEKSVRRVGGLRPKSFNARIVAATNRDLEAAIAEGAFRPDLYYRIKALSWISRPPSRGTTSRCCAPLPDRFTGSTSANAHAGGGGGSLAYFVARNAGWPI
jgi:two-component system nitrogen regulation response regulator GlnG